MYSMKADPIKVVYDLRKGMHYGYLSATRTLCGQLLLRGVRGHGAKSMPSCRTCRSILSRWVREGLERHPAHGTMECLAFTRKGDQCQRDPIPGLEYCPSHKHLHPDAKPVIIPVLEPTELNIRETTTTNKAIERHWAAA